MVWFLASQTLPSPNRTSRLQHIHGLHLWLPLLGFQNPSSFPCLTRVCLSAYSVDLIFTASTSSSVPCSPGPAHTSCSLCLLLDSTQVVHMVVRPLGCRHSTSLTRENTLLCFHYCLLAHLLPVPPTTPQTGTIRMDGVRIPVRDFRGLCCPGADLC